MKKFLNESYLLDSNLAKKLYKMVNKLPVIDYHCHVSAEELYNNFVYKDITEALLINDDYKWRVMRANGINENYVTGKAQALEKFHKYCHILPRCIGNPIYHWSHLELKRYFNINDIIEETSANSIFLNTKELLKKDDYRPCSLLKRMNIEIICTTNSPSEDLKFHKLLKEKIHCFKVLPTFRLDKYLHIELQDFLDNLQTLENIENEKINNVEILLDCLKHRLLYFIENGCLITDQGFDEFVFGDISKDLANRSLMKKLNGDELSYADIISFKSYVLFEMAKSYFDSNLVMQLHIGAVRNNSSHYYSLLGNDAGADSISDLPFIHSLSSFLNELDKLNKLTKTVLYNLDYTKNYALSSLIGCFQDGITRGKIQLGTGWWYNDNIHGINHQLDTLSTTGVLGNFIGMLTDSSSLFSYVRIEYFRRILCNFVANQVKCGLYPKDLCKLKKLVSDICYYNVKEYIKI